MYVQVFEILAQWQSNKSCYDTVDIFHCTILLYDTILFTTSCTILFTNSWSLRRQRKIINDSKHSHCQVQLLPLYNHCYIKSSCCSERCTDKHIDKTLLQHWNCNKKEQKCLLKSTSNCSHLIVIDTSVVLRWAFVVSFYNRPRGVSTVSVILSNENPKGTRYTFLF